MKKFAWFGLGVFVAVVSLMSLGCKNSYENMIKEFDEKYFLPEPKVYVPYSVNSPDFDPKDMLAPSYVFSEDVFINLEAPENCISYSWNIVDSEGNNLIEKPVLERVFYHAAAEDFKIGDENILILTVTVTDSQGNIAEYIDKSVIIIKAQKNLGLEE